MTAIARSVTAQAASSGSSSLSWIDRETAAELDFVDWLWTRYRRRGVLSDRTALLDAITHAERAIAFWLRSPATPYLSATSAERERAMRAIVELQVRRLGEERRRARSVHRSRPSPRSLNSRA